MRRRARLLVPIFALALALGACGGDDADPEATDPGTPAATGTDPAASVTACPDDPAGDNILAVEASDEFAYVPAELEASAGEVTIDFDNPGLTMHSFVIEGTDVGMLAQSGGGCTATVTLDPGTYTVYCDVVGHRDAGMETTLTVT